MAKLVVGSPIDKGKTTNRTAEVIDNDAFPTLINAYQWRGRVKRKRGTSLLNRLKYYVGTTDGSGALSATLSPTTIATGTSQFVVGSVTLTDPGGSSPVTLLTTGAATGTLNRSTGALAISGAAAATAVYWFPALPVMGIEDFVSSTSFYPGTVAFDTDFSYTVSTTSPFLATNNNFYLNPASATYVGYTQKSSWTPLWWNGQNYQQFYSTNYEGAMWATNGITSPFSITNIGMQYKAVTGVVIDAAGPPALATLTIVGHGLVQGDFVFINEIGGVTGINFQTGYVVSADPQAANSVQVEFPNATLGGAFTTAGIAQYLTSRSDTTKDCIRWYNGDPTNSGVPANYGKGWVNFCPPLSNASYPISGLPSAQYYLVGARMIVPFKDRLLFIGPVVQTSAAGSQIYLQDTIIYSQNGTPYYTCSFTGDVLSGGTTFTPILVPTNQSAAANSWFEDITGYGGFLQAGVDQPINTVSANEDVLILGFSAMQARIIYTGNDILPFNLFTINSELGSSSTFSALNLDKGVVSRGSRGYVIVSQTGAARIDLDIPDQSFEINLSANGAERITAARDFVNEWIYFSYRANESNESTYIFNTETLLYNYRDLSWGVIKETFTTYGLFRKQTGFTWATVGGTFPTWSSWNAPWDSGGSTVLNPDVIGGNQQGFLIIKEDDTTNEATSLTIQNLSGAVVTSPNHCLVPGDFIRLSGITGSTNASALNGKIVQVMTVTDANIFNISTASTGTYTGGGLITKCYVPQIQTKMFPLAWDSMRKTRIGPASFLFSATPNAQVTLQIFLSMDAANAFNEGNIVPDVNSQNDSLIYTDVLYTCQEAENIGLTPANINLNQLPLTATKQRIWHRMNTSLIGDTVQIGITLSRDQMFEVDDDGEPVNAFAEIELHGAILEVNPSQYLC